MTNPLPDLRILILADDSLARAGLAALLAGQPGCIIAGQVASSDDLLEAIQAHRPNLLLWDLGWDPAPTLERMADPVSSLRHSVLPCGQTLEAVREPLAVLLADETNVAEAWSTGARVLLRRDVAPERLVAALRAASQGWIILDPSFVAGLVLVQQPPERTEWQGVTRSPLIEDLTRREVEVLRLLAEGLPNKTIASRLRISEHTVKFHVNAILGKLGAASRTEAVVRATRLGLIPL